MKAAPPRTNEPGLGGAWAGVLVGGPENSRQMAEATAGLSRGKVEDRLACFYSGSGEPTFTGPACALRPAFVLVVLFAQRLGPDRIGAKWKGPRSVGPGLHE